VKGILGIVIYNKKAITYINILWRRGRGGGVDPCILCPVLP